MLQKNNQKLLQIIMEHNFALISIKHSKEKKDEETEF